MNEFDFYGTVGELRRWMADVLRETGAHLVIVTRVGHRVRVWAYR